jgi:hypothetical protein
VADMDDYHRIRSHLPPAAAIGGPDGGKMPRHGAQKAVFWWNLLRGFATLFMTEVMSRVAFHESQERNGRKSGIHFNLRKTLWSPNFSKTRKT